ncbi:MAG: hypothetical protein ACOYD9_08835 [Pyramidobacter sp.]|jgi:hypothetical protein
MEHCVNCGSIEQSVPVGTGDCGCVNGGGEARAVKLVAPTRDTYENWVAHNPIVPEGVLCLVKDRLFDGSLEYLIGDGKSTFTELMSYAGAPLSRTGAQNCSPLAAQGKNTLDPSWLPDATATEKGAVKASTTQVPNAVVKADENGSLDGWRRAISETVADINSGLIVDANTDKIGVDFSQMPTDKFDNLLKGLKMQIPLAASMSIYVDKNHADAGDSLIDGRGTQNKPFKTIQACVDYVTQNYALGKYSVFINIEPGTYQENLRLPNFTRTVGAIEIKASDYNNPPTIVNAGETSNTVYASGGNWSFTCLNICGVFSGLNAQNPTYGNVLLVGGDKTAIYIRGSSISGRYEGATSAYTFVVRLISVNTGGLVSLTPLRGYQNSLECIQGNANNAAFLHTERGGQILIYNGNIEDDGIIYNIPCSGTATFFAEAYFNSSILNFLDANHNAKLTGSVTAKRYLCRYNSGMYAPQGGFPGNEDGIVVTSTGSWYMETPGN